MFSTMPSTGTPTLRNICSPLRASSSAISCGVVTMTAPETGTRWRQRELDVARARRHVDDQVVERAPARVGEHLGERLRDHRAAPGHGLVGIDQEADRHDRQTVAAGRIERLAVGRRRPRALQAHHARQARAVDVGVEQPDPGALGREGECQIRGDRRLADATLAGGDRDDVRDLGQRPLPRIGDECRDAGLDRIGGADFDALGREVRHRAPGAACPRSRRPESRERCAPAGPAGPRPRTRWRRPRRATGRAAARRNRPSALVSRSFSGPWPWIHSRSGVGIVAEGVARTGPRGAMAY